MGLGDLASQSRRSIGLGGQWMDRNGTMCVHDDTCQSELYECRLMKGFMHVRRI
jgi:hypothetical protein